MNAIEEQTLRHLEASDAAIPLIRLVDEVLQAYPDPYLLASRHAEQIMHKHTGRLIDPRFVWWHQFNSESSSSRSFTGWQHRGPPQLSLILPELIVERFDAYFQEAVDELDMRGGFYRQGPHAAVYDERNEVPMLGSAVQQDLWALDFATLYRSEVEQFWAAQGKNFRILTKINLLGEGARALLGARISQLDWQRLRAFVDERLTDGCLPTLESLSRDSASAPFTVNRFVFGAGDRGALFTLQASDGRVVAYRPWHAEALWAFDSELAMARWLAAQLQTPQALDSFVAGANDSRHEPAAQQLIRVHLAGIADSRSDDAALRALKLFERRLKGDLFTYLQAQASAEMRLTAQLMRDNHSLRKAMLSGYLSAFLGVFGGFVPLGWPMSLMVLGASVGKVALDVDAALHAADEQTRKSALREAVLESLFASLSLVDVAFQSSLTWVASQAPPHETGVALEHWQVSTSATLSAEGQESNLLLSGELGSSGRLRGIRMTNDGKCWISSNGFSCRVRYSHELSAWLVVPTDNPYAFVPLKPVRLNADGEWELLMPPRLLGGSPPVVEGMPSTTSPFWDTYTSKDEVLSTGLAERALRRQKALLENWPVAELAQGEAPEVDERGLECVRVRGRPYYSYRYGNEYFNALIEWYTGNQSTVNDVFRAGRYEYGDEDSYVGDLANSLGLLPKSNEVTLYRGGHRSRGTSGELYRNGHLKVGDVLVNTDLTSFTENPYKVAEFASLPFAGAPGGLPGLFDDSSVIFELTAGGYWGATPISAFSIYWKEGETLMLPGNYFRIEGLEQVYGEHYRFIKVMLGQTGKPVSGPVYDMRTGLPFDEVAYRARFRTPSLVQRFFPA
ncbi:dermonecrotic toxin domain-containing protein [Pseudomonas sp. NPDC008258]|uniref:dermonecrotic toxin domain-containing protein n=1 Tax=Pseudomonas sp. NPDC008258 TaxID=3364418 RepID=UPI0036E920A6